MRSGYSDKYFSDTPNCFCKILSITLFFLLIQLAILHDPAMAEQSLGKPDTQWSILAGYGTSHPGWGETETRVETIDLVLRRSSILIDDIGSSWYKGYHSLFIELPLHFLIEPRDTPMIGMNFLATYTFTSSILQPYLFAGGGPVYVAADIDGMGSDWNGNYQIGAGLKYDIDNQHTLLFECRYHHISNLNTKDPNLPLNSTKFLIGYTF
jgi:lipid A 3-O-deacylase